MESRGRRAIFFDLDDTLYDHLVPFRNAVREVIQPDESVLDVLHLFDRVRYHSDQLWPRYLQGEFSLDETRVRRMEIAFSEFGIHLSREQATLVQKGYIGRQYNIEMIDGVLPQLTRLMEEGHVVGIITNGPVDHQMSKIRGLGVDKLIPSDRIFISDAVGIAKPDPEIFAYVNRTTGTTADNSVYVGDTWHNDVVGALDAGWEMCWYNPRGKGPGSDHKPTHTFRNYEEFSLLPIT
ncbi:putative hydrolase of the HAD superfamily [Paenibacillus forsythiae]|uniref:Hydrolase of the HAD superfamily n=1 Tax=Paenibacillus forsythiae TaxID=365616 RepID=A0ABU3H694_9BACL|nr:HAD family hydrolase [Paenibacillus forsythiae]MDT3425971.1 putative hydrolase of the HAD superfamily [Paenibacillus forsythiae]